MLIDKIEEVKESMIYGKTPENKTKKEDKKGVRAEVSIVIPCGGRPLHRALLRGTVR